MKSSHKTPLASAQNATTSVDGITSSGDHFASTSFSDKLIDSAQPTSTESSFQNVKHFHNDFSRNNHTKRNNNTREFLHMVKEVDNDAVDAKTFYNNDVASQKQRNHQTNDCSVNNNKTNMINDEIMREEQINTCFKTDFHGRQDDPEAHVSEESVVLRNGDQKNSQGHRQGTEAGSSGSSHKPGQKTWTGEDNDDSSDEDRFYAESFRCWVLVDQKGELELKMAAHNSGQSSTSFVSVAKRLKEANHAEDVYTDGELCFSPADNKVFSDPLSRPVIMWSVSTAATVSDSETASSYTTSLVLDSTTARASDSTTATISEITALPASDSTTATTSEITALPASDSTTATTSEITTLPASDSTTATTSEITTLPASDSTTATTSEITTLPASDVTTLPASDITTLPASLATDTTTLPASLATDTTTLPASLATDTKTLPDSITTATDTTTLPATDTKTLRASLTTASDTTTLPATDTTTLPASLPTASDSKFKYSYMSRRKCLIQRANSQQEYHRLSTRMYDQDRQIVIDRLSSTEDLGLHILDSYPAYITSVDPDSAAERAGVTEGQILVSVNNHNVLATNHADIIKLIHSLKGSLTLGVASSDFQPVRDLQAATLSGHMLKLGNSGLKIWKRRFFVLRQDNCLYYYRSDQETDPLGAFPLGGYIISRHTETSKEFCFKAEKFGARSYYFCVDNRDQLTEWVGALSKTSARSKKRNDSFLSVSSLNIGLPALHIPSPECAGFLSKLSPSGFAWRRRYCVLKDACVYYYQDKSSLSALGVIHLHGYTTNTENHQRKKYSFSLHPPEQKMRVFAFCADNETDKRSYEASSQSTNSFARGLFSCNTLTPMLKAINMSAFEVEGNVSVGWVETLSSSIQRWVPVDLDVETA